MVAPRICLFVVENKKYFKALKNFLAYTPEDIYVNKSALTDILLEYLLTGEAQEELIKRTRLAIEVKDILDEEYFIDSFRESSSELLQPLREMLSEKIPEVAKDIYTIEQIRVVPATQTIIMRLRRHETNLSPQQHLAGNGAQRETKRTH